MRSYITRSNKRPHISDANYEPINAKIPWKTTIWRWIIKFRYVMFPMLAMALICGIVIGVSQKTTSTQYLITNSSLSTGISSSSSSSSIPISSSSSSSSSVFSSSSIPSSSAASSSSSSSSIFPLSDVIVGAGQSNMQGYGSGVDTFGLDLASPLLQQFTFGDQHSGVQTIQNQVIHAAEPLNDGSLNAIGPLVRLGNNFVGKTNSNLILVQSAVGGTSISQWNQTLFARSSAGLTSLSTTITPRVLMIAWLQGENDIGTDPNVYQTSLINLITNFRTNTIGTNSTTPFVLLGMVPEWVRDNSQAYNILDVLRGIPNLVPYTAYRQPALGFPDCNNGEIHYSSTGQRMNAQLYFDAYNDAISNYSPGLIPNHPATCTMTQNANGYMLTWSTVTGATNYILIYRRYITWIPAICADLDDTTPFRLLLNITTGSIQLPNNLFTNSTQYQFDVSALKGNQPSSQRIWSTFNSYSNPDTVYPSNLIAYLPLQASAFYDNINKSNAATTTYGSYVFNASANAMQVTLGGFGTNLIPSPVGTLCMRWSVNELLLGVFGRAIYGTIARADLSSGSKYLGVSPSGIYGIVGLTMITGPIVTPYTMYHACMTYTSSLAQIYLNGVLVESSALTGVTNPTSNDAISIGGQYARANPWNGLFSCMTVWNTVLDASSILALYNAGSSCI
jgi:hypothetical protein